MKRNIDYSIYLVTDRDLMSAKTIEIAVEQAILGGATVVQLREKNIESLDFYNTALSVKSVCDRHNVPLIINDRIDIALAVKADGVHIGQSDIQASIVRKIIGDDMILGVSATNIQEAIKAKEDGADYLGVGAMFATNTKQDAKIVSKQQLTEIIKTVKLPTVIIGGINEKTIPMFSDVDIDGVAVVSAIIAKEDIKNAATEIKNLFFDGRRKTLDNIKGAIFDLDGTILDSLDVWKNIDIEFLNDLGCEIPSNYIDAVSALSFKEAAEYTIKTFKLNHTAKELMDKWYNMAIVHYGSQVKLLPYALDYIKAIKAQGIKLCVATGLSRQLYEPCLKCNGIFELFDGLLSVDDVGVGKESPQIYYEAMNLIGVKPNECIVFEDILPAIKCAKETGAYVYGIKDKYSLKFTDEILKVADGYIKDFRFAPILKI